MKKIAISTWCIEDYAVYLKPDNLKKLVNHFHPEIDFHIVDTKQTEDIKKQNPWMLKETVRYPDWMMVMSCLPFVEDYDMVIHMDADSFCIGSLDKVIESNKELIDDFCLVSEEEIVLQIKNALNIDKMRIEGSAAVAIASAIKMKSHIENKNVAIIICGGNIGSDTLNKIL